MSPVNSPSNFVVYPVLTHLEYRTTFLAQNVNDFVLDDPAWHVELHDVVAFRYEHVARALGFFKTGVNGK